MSLREPKRRSARLRIHWLLLDDPQLPDAIAASLEDGVFPSTMRAIVDRVRGVARPEHCYEPRQAAPVVAGEWVNLERVLDAVQRHLPGDLDRADVQISWGRRSNTRRRARSIRLGSLVERDRLIRVHPALDNAWVPPFVIEYVVYHELCHFHAPPLTEAEARQRQEHRIHHGSFRALESAYPLKDRAQRWLDANLHRLLASGAKP